MFTISNFTQEKPNEIAYETRIKIFSDFFLKTSCVGSLYHVIIRAVETNRKSNKMGYVPIYALNKTKVSSLVTLKVYRQLKKRADEREMTLSNYISVILYSAVLNDPWTEEDEKFRSAMIEENRRKRKLAQDRLNERQNRKKKGTD